MSDLQSQELLNRNEISDQEKWNLKDIYASDQAWEEDYQQLQQFIPQLQQYKGKLNSADRLLACIKMQEQVGKQISRLYSYAMMSKDQDNTEAKYQEFTDKMAATAAIVASKLAYIEPEILSLPSATVKEWLEQQQELKAYEHYLKDVLRTKPHTLPTELEELLAGASDMAQAPSNIFRMFNNADLKFPVIKDETGDEIELTHGRYIKFLENQDRRVRKDAFKAMYSTYGHWKNTLAVTYTAAVKKALFFARTRKYDSTLEAALDNDNIKPEVYHNLIDTVHDNLPLFYRYLKLRKRLLAVDELHMYDVYVPIVKDVEMKISPSEAKDMVREGLEPLGERYIKDLTAGLNNGWIDWRENRGKTSGAYSTSVHGVHPYVLLNYQDNIDNMFTLAHEMGHAMHSFYADLNQTFINAQYPIFVAEVASTLNECLVMNDLLTKMQDPRQKLFLLNHYLEQFRGTVFRQTMFAEFEMIVHKQIGQGNPMTAKSLSEQYYKLNQQYFGPDMVCDQEIEMEWGRIPHFYRPFYVYKYATGFSAAVALSQQILHDKHAKQRFLEFLSSGSTDYPLNLLYKAGVDMAKPQPIISAMEVFGALIAQMEELVAEL